MRMKPYRMVAPLALLMPILIASCGDKSQDDNVNSQTQNLNGCDLNGQCTTPGQFCYSHQVPGESILWCDVSDPLNMHYTTSCSPGYYCEAGLFDECWAGETLLICDYADNNLVVSGCGDGFVASNEACDENDGSGPCDGTCSGDCTAILTGCGDGELCGTEQCDDGDSVSNDGCDANCNMTGCGNGEETVGEGCDDGNDVDGDGCDSNCQPTGCGNGLTVAPEMCDDANNINGDGCDNDCTTSECGNGIVVFGEQCDDGNDINGDGCQQNCMLPDCGDGWIDPNEECDDGEDNAADASCTPMCTNAECGDGYVHAEEECDEGDMNGFGNDCNVDCTIPTCGDGTVDPNEECDDGNLVNGDGCDAECVTEPDCVEQTPVPCQEGAYGCLQGTSASYCLAAGNVTLECQCFNPNDFNKGTWLPPGSSCDNACWNDGGTGGAGGSGGTGGAGGAGGSTTTTSGTGGSGGGVPTCADESEDCSDAACCPGFTCVDTSNENAGPFVCQIADCNDDLCETDGDCCNGYVCDNGDCEPSDENVLVFTWTEPGGYNQPAGNDVTAQGMLDGGSWGVLCTMAESAPGSGVWSCAAILPVGSQLIFNIGHEDPSSVPSGMCWAFDQCAWYCAGDGSNFGTVTVENSGMNVPYTQSDNGIDPFMCSQNGVIASIPGGS